MSEEKRIKHRAVNRAVRELAFDLKAEFAKALPDGVRACAKILREKTATPALKVKVTEMMADRLYGRPPMAITGSAGGPLLVSFTQILEGIAGDRQEKL